MSSIAPIGFTAYNAGNKYLNVNKANKSPGLYSNVNKSAESRFTYIPINNPTNFRGAPYKLDFNFLQVPEKGSITAKKAIEIFERFKLGNYLDIGDDTINYARNAEIRKENLSFLDKVTAPAEKQEFISYYKELTGFPSLYQVSENIKIAFVKAVTQASEFLNKSRETHGYDIIQAGYDGICSVGRHKALPGSDLDKAYIIIRGTGRISGDPIYVKNFMWKLWDFTDQRILSYNHDAAAFPQVYTQAQFNALIKKADEACEKMNIRSFSLNPIDTALSLLNYDHLILNRDVRKYNEYKQLQNTYTTDYIKANKFYIELCRQFPIYTGFNVFEKPTKEVMKNIGFVIETMREGVHFTKFGKIDYSKLMDSTTFNLVNLSQLKALKTRGDKKPKRLARMRLEKDFDTWDIDKQFRFIKTLIASSCANNTDFTKEFSKYFSRGGEDLFAPLIKQLLK